MPTSRITEGWSEKMPTTSVWRRISLFSCSCGLMLRCQTTAVYVGGDRLSMTIGNSSRAMQRLRIPRISFRVFAALDLRAA
jgi:hypothetical protein